MGSRTFFRVLYSIPLVALFGCATAPTVPGDPFKRPVEGSGEPSQWVRDRLIRQEQEQKQRSPNLVVARSLIESRQYELARTYLEEVVKSDSKSSEAYRLLGVIHREKGEFKLSRQLFEKARERDPDAAEVYDGVGILDLLEENPAEANRSFRKATELTESGSRYHNNLGFSYYLLGDLERAIGSYEKAVQLDPSVARFHNNLGYAYAMSRRYPDAMRQFLLAGTEAMAFANLAFSYQAQGDTKQARDLYRMALEADPALEAAQKNLALLCESQGGAAPDCAPYPEATTEQEEIP